LTKNLNKSFLPYLELIFTVIAWGASFVAIKIAVQQVSPITLVWLRFGLGVIILGGALVIQGQRKLPSFQEAGYFALLGFLGITFHQWLQSTAMLTAQASTAAWIVATIPLFMALLGWLVLKEHLGWTRTGGIILAALGVLLVVSNGKPASLIHSNFGKTGDFLILISALNWAVFSVLSRPGLQRFPATWMMFYVMCWGWLFSSLLFFSSPRINEISRITLSGWLWIGFLGIICSGLAYLFYYDGLKVIPASQVGAFLNLEPLVTMLIAATMIGEAIYLVSVFGGAMILAGVWLVNKPDPVAANAAPKPARK
jgi:drug/metabolite transporter (DMT)-like permease